MLRGQKKQLPPKDHLSIANNCTMVLEIVLLFPYFCLLVRLRIILPAFQFHFFFWGIGHFVSFIWIQLVTDPLQKLLIFCPEHTCLRFALVIDSPCTYISYRQYSTLTKQKIYVYNNIQQLSSASRPTQLLFICLLSLLFFVFYFHAAHLNHLFVFSLKT